MKKLDQISFPETAERICALYNEEQDAMLLGMLGQEYTIRHDGVFLRGQKAPELHAAVVMDYVSSGNAAPVMVPWRTIVDFTGHACPDFRSKMEMPLLNYIPDIIGRAVSILPMVDATAVPSIIGSDMAITVRALPKVYLHAELSQETQDFPAEVWLLFSNNANTFLTLPSLNSLVEIFKDRLVSLLRIY